MVLVTSPFNWHHVVTLTFDIFQGQICCRAGEHNPPNLLVIWHNARLQTGHIMVWYGDVLSGLRPPVFVSPAKHSNT